jgi:protein translocase SecG subunit
MQFLSSVLPYIEVALAVLLVLLVLLQQRGANVGNSFGGDGFGYTKRRGAERFIFFLSIGIALLFVISAITVLLI